MQCAWATLPSVDCPALIFSILSHKWHDLRKKKYKMCSYFLCKFCLKLLSFYEEMSDTWSKMHFGLHVKYTLFLLYLSRTWSFSTVFRKILNITFQENQSSDSRIFPWGRTDGQKRHDEANCRSSQFCKRAKLYVAITNVTRLHIVKSSKQWRRRSSSTVVTYTQILCQINYKINESVCIEHWCLLGCNIMQAG